MSDGFDEFLAESMGISVEELRERAGAIEFIPMGEAVEVDPGHYVLQYDVQSNDGENE